MKATSDNILFIDRVRKKIKSFWHHFTFSVYYESEKISLKEKVYTFLYNMQRTGFTTKGELDWSIRMMEIDHDAWKAMEKSFNKDYRQFLNKEAIEEIEGTAQ